MFLERGVQPEVFLDGLTPLRLSGLLMGVLQECAGAGPLATLRHLHARRGLRFGQDTMPPADEARRLAQRWIEERLPGLPPEDLDLTEGLRQLGARLGWTPLLAAAWWKRFHLEVPLPDGGSLHWLVEHDRGLIRKAEILPQPPAAELRLRLPSKDLARLYCVDGRSGLKLLARAVGVLRSLELISGRRRPSPLSVLRSLRLALGAL